MDIFHSFKGVQFTVFTHLDKWYYTKISVNSILSHLKANLFAYVHQLLWQFNRLHTLKRKYT